MNDKKSCENCGRLDRSYCDNDHRPLCEMWRRNSAMWLSIPPTEPGVYFYRKHKCKKWKVGALIITSRGLVWSSNQKQVKGNFQWQGPITPKG